MSANQRLGRAGEELAAEHLRGLGYEVVDRNFRCRHGEVDLVCRRRGEIALVEVKTRAGTGHGLPGEAIDDRKQRAMAACSGEYRRATGWAGPLRFHLVTVEIDVVNDVLV